MSDDRLRTHPKERLAPPVQLIGLTEAIERLRAEAHASVAGHRQLALVRRGPFSLILFAFEADGFLKEHKADGDVIIQVLAGRLEVTVAGDVVSIKRGELMSLAPGQAHAVHALEVSDMLLSLCKVP
jgi:quercetin dioxygenase-like cupin family protein